MNEVTLTQLKVLVERAVRPVRAGLRNKQKMREEMLAHVSAAYEEELDRSGDPAAALARTAERFGDPVELTAQLQTTVPWRDAVDRQLDRVWFRPGEPTLRRAVRHALLLNSLVFVYLMALFAILHGAGDLLGGQSPLAAIVVYSTSVLLAMFFFVVGFTFLAEWLRRVLDGPTGRPMLLKLVLIAVASGLLLPGLGFGLWLDGAELSVKDLLLVLALGLVVPGMVVHLAKALAMRLRDHREWASLPLDGRSA